MLTRFGLLTTMFLYLSVSFVQGQKVDDSTYFFCSASVHNSDQNTDDGELTMTGTFRGSSDRDAPLKYRDEFLNSLGLKQTCDRSTTKVTPQCNAGGCTTSGTKEQTESLRKAIYDSAASRRRKVRVVDWSPAGSSQ